MAARDKSQVRTHQSHECGSEIQALSIGFSHLVEQGSRGVRILSTEEDWQEIGSSPVISKVGLNLHAERPQREIVQAKLGLGKNVTRSGRVIVVHPALREKSSRYWLVAGAIIASQRGYTILFQGAVKVSRAASDQSSTKRIGMRKEHVWLNIRRVIAQLFGRVVSGALIGVRDHVWPAFVHAVYAGFEQLAVGWHLNRKIFAPDTHGP